MPSAGARRWSASIDACGAIDVGLRLLALARFLPSSSASEPALADSPFASTSFSRCSASASDSLAPSYSIREIEIALAEIELRALDVVLRLHQVGRLLLLGDPRLRLRLLDLALGWSSARSCRSCSRCCSDVASNSTTTSPFLTIVPFFTSLTICSSPPAWSGAASTIDLAGPDVAADLDVVDEIAARDLRGRARSAPAPSARSSRCRRRRPRRRRRAPASARCASVFMGRIGPPPPRCARP